MQPKKLWTLKSDIKNLRGESKKHLTLSRLQKG